MALISIWVYGSPQALTSFKVLLQDSTNQLCDCVILEVICEDTFLSDVSNSPLFSLSNQYLFSLPPNYQREYEPFWGRIRKFNMPDVPLANKSALFCQTNPCCFAREIHLKFNVQSARPPLLSLQLESSGNREGVRISEMENKRQENVLKIKKPNNYWKHRF